MFEKITSRQNKTVKHMRALARERELRAETGEFVCDGEKLLYEAMESGMEITSVLASESFAESLPQISDAKMFVAPDDVLESVTTLKSAQKVIFTCRKKALPVQKPKKVLLLDRLQDTGNIGTIIRTADAFGIDAIYEDGSADVYNPKTIRSAMGSIFRTPVISADFEELIPQLQASGMTVYASELYGEVVSVSDCSFENAAVVIGNEGNGVRKEIAKLCDKSVLIPMQGNAESLNAAIAAAIFMFKMSER